MKPDEMLTDIYFPIPQSGHNSTFIKFALRRAQAISVVNTAIVLGWKGEKLMLQQSHLAL